MNDRNYHEGMIDPLNKGLGPFQQPLSPAQASQQHWNLLQEELSLPAAVLYEERLEHNLRWMQRFVTEYGVKLAPHGKTTMSPQLFAQQFADGAWGIRGDSCSIGGPNPDPLYP